jgi:hypothetical protein
LALETDEERRLVPGAFAEKSALSLALGKFLCHDEQKLLFRG